jgi:hypothetical protein
MRATTVNNPKAARNLIKAPSWVICKKENSVPTDMITTIIKIENFITYSNTANRELKKEGISLPFLRIICCVQ